MIPTRQPRQPIASAADLLRRSSGAVRTAAAFAVILGIAAPLRAEGGRAGLDSDLSVTGWVVAALHAAELAGLEVPASSLKKVGGFLDSVSLERGTRYCYQPHKKERSAAMTAVGVYCRQHRGAPRDDPGTKGALEWITADDHRIDFEGGGNRNTYFWYYAAQCCRHAGDPYWTRWNRVMGQAVPAAQVKRGREEGSWDPDLNDPFEVHGGRLYVTCLCILMLESYYRYPSVYEQDTGEK